jgi:hypothetical protein
MVQGNRKGKRNSVCLLGLIIWEETDTGTNKYNNGMWETRPYKSIEEEHLTKPEQESQTGRLPTYENYRHPD